MKGKTIAVVSVLAAATVALVVTLLLAARRPAPGEEIEAGRSDIFGHPALPSAQPVPTGRPAAVSDEFRREPCAAVTVEELGVALAQEFHTISGTYPRRDRAPAASAAGCVYSYLADGSDPAEAYHRLEVTVAQAVDGAKALSDCLAAASKTPYGPVPAGDQACLGAGSIAVMRLGTNHYTVKVAVTPPRADRKDEETELAALVAASAKLFAARLPRR